MQKTQDAKGKAPNDIRIGMNSRPRRVIQYATSVMKEQNLRELKFSAVGGSIGKLLDTVEVLKIMTPGFYQQNKITSVAYQTVDSNKTVLNQRLYPKMEITLSLDEFKVKNEGTQDKMDENTRKEIEKKMEARREERQKERESGRRPFRGGRRGGRGFRGGRGRGFRRGGPFRGNRGGPRRGFRGGRGRGNFGARGSNRGGRGNEARVNKTRGK